MRKSVSAIALLLSITSANADQLDVLLKNRATMVAAITLLVTLPSKCFVGNEKPSDTALLAFMTSYGYRADDAFAADVKEQTKKVYDNDAFMKLSEHERAKVVDVTCGYGALLSLKVKEIRP